VSVAGRVPGVSAGEKFRGNLDDSDFSSKALSKSVKLRTGGEYDRPREWLGECRVRALNIFVSNVVLDLLLLCPGDDGDDGEEGAGKITFGPDAFPVAALWNPLSTTLPQRFG